MKRTRRGGSRWLAAAWLTVTLGHPVHAESALRFPIPGDLGTKAAVTHDANGRPVGQASMSLEKTGDTTVQLAGTARVDTGGRTRVEAEFEILDNGRQMKLVRQLSESITVEGRSLGILRIHHEKGTASCTPPPGSDLPVTTLPLPPIDRVANVPLQLLFAPLARGEQDELRFDVLLCRDNPRFMEFEAWVVEPESETLDTDAVEIRYRPALGSVVGFLAQAVVPDLRFWVDGPDKNRYVGHRMPLYSKGPEIWVLRDGVSPSELRTGLPPSQPPIAKNKENNHDEN